MQRSLDGAGQLLCYHLRQVLSYQRCSCPRPGYSPCPQPYSRDASSGWEGAQGEEGWEGAREGGWEGAQGEGWGEGCIHRTGRAAK